MITCPLCTGQIPDNPQLAGLPVCCPHCYGTFRVPALQTEFAIRTSATRVKPRHKGNSTALWIAAGMGLAAIVGVLLAMSQSEPATNASKQRESTFANRETKHDARETARDVGQVALLVVAVCVYFFPTFIAAIRRHHNVGSIAVINIFLGWTFLGWVGALAMAFSWVRTGKHR